MHLRKNDGSVSTDVLGYSSMLLVCEWQDDLRT